MMNYDEYKKKRPLAGVLGSGLDPYLGPIGAGDSTGWTSPRPEEDSDDFSSVVVPVWAFEAEPSLLAPDIFCPTR